MSQRVRRDFFAKQITPVCMSVSTLKAHLPPQGINGIETYVKTVTLNANYDNREASVRKDHL